MQLKLTIFSTMKVFFEVWVLTSCTSNLIGTHFIYLFLIKINVFELLIFSVLKFIFYASDPLVHPLPLFYFFIINLTSANPSLPFYSWFWLFETYGMPYRRTLLFIKRHVFFLFFFSFFFIKNDYPL